MSLVCQLEQHGLGDRYLVMTHKHAYATVMGGHSGIWRRGMPV